MLWKVSGILIGDNVGECYDCLIDLFWFQRSNFENLDKNIRFTYVDIATNNILPADFTKTATA